MKAIEILDWICRESIEGEFLNIVEVPEEGEHSWEQNEEWWTNMFGACPPHPIIAGKYLYYYRSSFYGEYITDNHGNITLPDAEIELPTESDFDYIYLYKLED